MHRTDEAAHSAMVTTEIAVKLAPAGRVKAPASLQKFIMSTLSRQVKSKSLDKTVYRYLVRILIPKSPGFLVRWRSYFNRYQQIAAAEKEMAGKSDWERLMAALKELHEQSGFVTAIDTLDSHSFTGAEQTQVASHGFACVCQSQRKVVDENGFFTELFTVSVFTPNEGARAKALGAFQLYNLDLYEPETNVQAKQVGHICLIGTTLQQRKIAA